MVSIERADFEAIWLELGEKLLETYPIEVGEWQAIRGDEHPMATTYEIRDVSLKWPLPYSQDELVDQIDPNLPWAEDHFQERISGIAYNPPPSHEYWPFAQESNTQHRDSEGYFSHTYPERFWPRQAGDTRSPRKGIRFHYGDLSNLIELLKQRPHTRQAYLPIWHPEDLTAATYEERVPCTLGYHFLQRQGALHITYFMRSCDFFRYFRDDVYMAGRLCQHIARKLQVPPGHLVMHIVSLHIFDEKERLQAQVQARKTQQLFKGLSWK